MTSRKDGLLLINLGSPASPDPAAVRAYLDQFLSDPDVVSLPRWLWRPLLRYLILPRRSPRSAALYRSIWLPDGSPLVTYSQRLAEGVARHLPDHYRVACAMRYGQPDIQGQLAELRDQGCERLTLLPLYPQYATSTTGSAVKEVARALALLQWQPALRLLSSYETAPGYVEALARQVRTAPGSRWPGPRADTPLVLSFHGLPQRVVDRGDPYQRHCLATARALRERLSLDQTQCLTGFQSRFGPARWIGPATDDLLRDLAGKGVREAAVFCPGFLCDCLETLEEIKQRGSEAFIAAGGEALHYIPCLNDDDRWAAALAALALDAPEVDKLPMNPPPRGSA